MNDRQGLTVEKGYTLLDRSLTLEGCTVEFALLVHGPVIVTSTTLLAGCGYLGTIQNRSHFAFSRFRSSATAQTFKSA